MLGFGQLNKDQPLAHPLLLLHRHPVELLPQDVLHIYLLHGDEFAFSGRPAKALLSQPHIHFPELAGIQQVAGLSDEAEEGAQIEGEFARNEVPFGLEAEPDELGQRLGVFLDFDVLISDFSDLQLVSSQLSLI